MHEWALAESICLTAIDIAKREKFRKIKEIQIVIGELQQIEKDILKFAIDQIRQENKELNQAEIKMRIEKATLKCRNCGSTWNFENIKKNINKDVAEAMHFIPETAFAHTRCPKCGSPDFGIEKGRGVYISKIKGEK